jgi:hypothetical protein
MLSFAAGATHASVMQRRQTRREHSEQHPKQAIQVRRLQSAHEPEPFKELFPQPKHDLEALALLMSGVAVEGVQQAAQSASFLVEFETQSSRLLCEDPAQQRDSSRP